jgi:hypothetical protein
MAHIYYKEDIKTLVDHKGFFFFFSLYCCAGWGYIVAFTNVLTIYQIYHI